MPSPKLESDAAKRMIADHLRRIGEAKGRKARGEAFDAMAADLTTLSDTSPVLLRFLSGDTNARRFAFELITRLEPPLPTNVIPLLIEQLGKTRFPSRLRIMAAAKVLRSIPADSLYIPRVIQSLERKVPAHQAASRLRRLEELVPPLLVLTHRRKELEQESLSTCPRCQKRLPQAEFVRHVWEQHRLLYERGRVVEPWVVVEEWVREFARNSNKELLDRSCELAQSLDPAGGLTRIHQLLLSSGAGDEEAHTLLRAEATQKNAGLCPHCFTLVPTNEPVPSAVLVGPMRIEAEGYRVELSDGLLLTQLVATTPQVVVYEGPEPGHVFTHRGAVLSLVGPILLLATALLALPPIKGLPLVAPVAATILTAWGLYLGLRFYRRDLEPPAERIVDHAWTVLVPRLLHERFRLSDAEFVAGLAKVSQGRGDGELRADEVRRVATELLRDRQGQQLLAPLQALLIDDVRREGGDDLLALADRVGECFTGPMALEHGNQLLAMVRHDVTDRTRRARLRVLVLARAFQCDLEADDLRLFGRVCPVFGTAYASEDRDGLTRLRLLWLYRTKRMWQRIGSATAVFDLARYPALADQYLRQRPDLLLFQASADGDEAAPILICEEGVVYRDAVISDRDEAIYVRTKSVVLGGGFDLHIGQKKYWFRNDPVFLAERLKAWTEFLFDEFLPRARLLYHRRSPRGERLLKQKRTNCPTCRQAFLWVRGDVGLQATAEDDE